LPREGILASAGQAPRRNGSGNFRHAARGAVNGSALLRRDGSPPVIPVVNYENPVIVEAVLQLNAYGVIASPVKSFGLLTSIVVSVNQAEKARAQENTSRVSSKGLRDCAR